jgi:hypothetical protein
MPKFEKNTVEFILLGYPSDFPEMGLSKHTRFHPMKKIINRLFPIKVDTTGFFLRKNSIFRPKQLVNPNH